VTDGVNPHILGVQLVRSTAPQLGVLVVGAGFQGARRAAAAVAAHGVRLIAICDEDRALAHAVARKHRVAAVRDLDAGLALSGVDAVVIATPPALHVDQARQALNADKDVLCEKPLAIDPADAHALALHADRCGMRLVTGFNHRYYPPVRDALGLARSGAIGSIHSLRAAIGHQASAAFLRSWHTDAAVSGGGTLADNGPHACDLIRRFLGEVATAQGVVRDTLRLPPGCESDAFAFFGGRSGAVAELRTSWRLERGYLTIDLRGSLGHLHIETAPWRLSGRLADGRRIYRIYLGARASEAWFRRKFGCERSLVIELEDFAAPESADQQEFATAWDGYRAAQMISAVYESAHAGSEIRLAASRVQAQEMNDPARKCAA
jgi:predicted dehydrogenase